MENSTIDKSKKCFLYPNKNIFVIEFKGKTFFMASHKKNICKSIVENFSNKIASYFDYYIKNDYDKKGFYDYFKSKIMKANELYFQPYYKITVYNGYQFSFNNDTNNCVNITTTKLK